VKAKPIVPRERATRDVDDAIDYYLAEGGPTVALGFIDALERAYLHVGRSPASGALRYAQELGIPDLRCWPLDRYPYLVFYVEREDDIDVWRILHGHRDVPASLREPEER